MNYFRYNGFLNIYKEPGWTSMDVCAKLRSLLGVKRIGHAGTLDPMAKGVLPVALGIATKDIEKISDSKKIYSACMLLGISTETDDVTGKVIGEYKDTLPGEKTIRELVLSYVGEYEQIPPRYSARKVNGRKLYEYARRGIDVERKPKKVHIYSIKLEKIELPRVYFSVSCSKGTYIRSLIRDIGDKLGCGACMEDLVRVAVGDFGIDAAFKLDEIELYEKSGDLDSLLSVKAPTCVAIGKFDGTHLGHQALLKELKNTASRLGLKTLVIIFDFGGKSLITREDSRHRMNKLGIDYCFQLKFTDEIKNTLALDFLKNDLIGKYNMKAIVAGDDVSFGKRREGNLKFLSDHAEELAYKFVIIKKISIKEDEEVSVISSTLLKERLREGRMDSVSRLLGENYFLEGRIVKGRHIGTDELGIPTLNLELSRGLILPPFGVYAVFYTVYDPKTKEKIYCGKGIANLGYAPTAAREDDKSSGFHSDVREDDGSPDFHPDLKEDCATLPDATGNMDNSSTGCPRLEVHAFENIDICYGFMARVELLKFIRPEQRFGSLEELKIQISERDIPMTKRFFLRDEDV